MRFSTLLFTVLIVIALVATPAASDNITISPPEIYPLDGTFTGDVTVTLVANQPHATLYWTKDGQTPTNASRVYTEPIYLFEPGTIKIQAIAITKTGNLGDSVVVSRTYVVNPSVVSIPHVSPPKGKYRGYASIVLSTTEVSREPTETDKTKREVKIQYVVDVDNPGDTWQTFSEAFPLDIPGEHIVKSRVVVGTTFVPVGKTEAQTTVQYSPIARYRFEITPALVYDVATECVKCANIPTVGKYFTVYLQNPEANSQLFLTTSSKGCDMNKHILDDTDYVTIAMKQVAYRFVTYTEPQPKVFVCLKEPSNVNQTFVKVPRRTRSSQQGVTEPYFAIEPAFGAIKKQDTSAPSPQAVNVHPGTFQDGRSSGTSVLYVFGGLCLAIMGVCVLLVKLMRGGGGGSGGRRSALRQDDDSDV